MTKPQRVYVATRFDWWPRAKEIHEALQLVGHEPMSRWIGIAERLNGQCDAIPMGSGERQFNALMDLSDIARSDVLLVLVPDDGGTGMWVELGYAYGLGKRIHCVGPAKSRTIFAELPGIKHHMVPLSALAAIGEGL